MNSLAFLKKFAAMDKNPADDPAVREKQIIQFTRKILKDVSELTDAQVLRLHGDYVRGRF